MKTDEDQDKDRDEDEARPLLLLPWDPERCPRLESPGPSAHDTLNITGILGETREKPPPPRQCLALHLRAW
jgi:hypothetical protein